MNILKFLFDIWPLVFIASGFLLVRDAQARGNLHKKLWFLFALWILWLLIGVIGRISPVGLQNSLLPEPWNWGGFLGLGLLSGGALLAWEWIRWREVEQRLEFARTLDTLQAMPPRDFEELIGDFFRRNGHQARVIGATGDHGLDLEIRSKSGEIWVSQCKRYKAQVGEPVVRDFYGALMHAGASKGFIFITSTFSPQAREWAAGKPIELIDGVQLVRLVRGLKKNKQADKK